MKLLIINNNYYYKTKQLKFLINYLINCSTYLAVPTCAWVCALLIIIN